MGMTSQDWTKLGLSAAVMAALVGLALLAGHIPALQQLYLQVSGSLLGLLGVHHGHDILANKLDDGEDNDAPKPPQSKPDDAPPPAPAPVDPPPPPPPAVLSVTAEELEAIMPHAGAARCQAHVQAINAAALRWDINTKSRLAMWLGNCALECNQLRSMEEEWVPTQEQLDYEPPHHVAKVLGNTQKGDGRRFMGRGVIQLTGRSNYQQAGHALGLDLEANPELAAEPGNAWSIAGWFWAKHGLNAVADQGNFVETVRRINGGLTDLQDRQTFYDRARQALA